jgi:hypothetical protein
MSGIDWSKAPEGYPVWIQDLHPGNAFDGSGWHKDEGNKYIDEDGEYWSKPEEGHYSVHHRPEDQPWTGDGLPPVGTVCEIAASTEYLKIRHPEGLKVKVYAVFTDDRGIKLAAFLDENGQVGGVCTEKCFRPIRTPEQIAAEERVEAIEKMWSIYWQPHATSAKQALGLLWDAGLRFADDPDNA